MNHNWIEKTKDAGQRFEIPVSEELWTRIQEDYSRQKSRKRRITVFTKRISVAVAVCIAGLICLNPLWKTDDAGRREQHGSDACVMYVNGHRNDDDNAVMLRMQAELNAISRMADISQ